MTRHVTAYNLCANLCRYSIHAYMCIVELLFYLVESIMPMETNYTIKVAIIRIDLKPMVTARDHNLKRMEFFLCCCSNEMKEKIEKEKRLCERVKRIEWKKWQMWNEWTEGSTSASCSYACVCECKL